MPSSRTRTEKPPEEPRPEVISQIVDAYIEGVEALPAEAQKVANRVLQEPILGEAIARVYYFRRATEEELALGRCAVEELYGRRRSTHRFARTITPKNLPATS